MGHYPLYLFSSRLLVTTDCPMVCTISSRLDSSSSLMTELRYNNTAVRRAVVCWVLWPVPGILAGGGTSRTSQLTPEPPLPAPAVVFQSSRRSLLLSAVSEVNTRPKLQLYICECTWSFDQTLPIICELPALIVIKNGLCSREQDPNKWWYRIYRQEYSLVKGSSGGIQRRLCRDWDIYKEIISQSRYQNFLKMHPDGRISRKSFHTMMKECYPGADTEKLERHIFRMYDSNKVSHGPGLRHEGHWQ